MKLVSTNLNNQATDARAMAKCITLLDAMEVMMKAWEFVTLSFITNCWRKSGHPLKHDASSSFCVSSVDVSGKTDDDEFASTVGLTTKK